MPTPADIRAARKRLGLTQDGAAALLPVTRLTWLRWETDKVPMPEYAWAYWRHVAGIERLPFRAASTIE
jgi:DNA-binding XRE family transcriptional regulator